MKSLKVFSDTAFGKAALTLLQAGVAPHELIMADAPATSALKRAGAEPLLLDVEIIFGQPDIESIRVSPRLRWVHLTSAGYTRYDTAEFRALAAERGLVVTNSTGVYAEPCAQHIAAFMLANARILPLALRTQCDVGTPQWLKLRRESKLLQKQTVIILGYGGIAMRLVEMLKPFDMHITAYRRKARGNENVPVVTLSELPQALGQADHVVNVLPANQESEQFINAERLAQMKPGAVLYNVGRGTTVDQEALVAALNSGHLGAAWLDVTEPEPLPAGHPLLSASNCFITPHIAGGHHNEPEMLVRHFLANLRRYEAGEELVDRIL